jgi:hypothetical protein
VERTLGLESIVFVEKRLRGSGRVFLMLFAALGIATTDGRWLPPWLNRRPGSLTCKASESSNAPQIHHSLPKPHELLAARR